MNNRVTPEITAPVIGELRLCAWTGVAWHDYGVDIGFVLRVLREQHAALDTLFAKNVLRDPNYFPSQQPEWSAIEHGNTVIKALTATFMRPIA